MKLIQFFLMIIFIPSVAFSFSGKGSGTEDDPYQITNINQMQELKNGSNKEYYVLMNDIDASETRTWNIGDHDKNPDTPDEPMGFEPVIFGAHLNGNGYVIRNLFINRPKVGEIGLFALCCGEIRRIGLENCDFTGLNHVGGLCGTSDGSFIEECYTTGKLRSTDTSYLASVGGFCAFKGISEIKNCYSSCSVSTASKKDYDASAFCFGLKYPASNASHCYATGKVNSSGKACVFGVENNANSVWDVETTGIPDETPPVGSYAIGLTTSEMMNRSIMDRYFDFEYIWCIEDGKDYPKLRAFGNCPTDVEPNNSKTDKFMIDAFPNPFTNATEIRYSLPKSGSVNIQIFNSLGITVKEILNESYSAEGAYKVIFDGSTLPSGIYFITLKTGGQAITNPIIIQK